MIKCSKTSSGLGHCWDCNLKIFSLNIFDCVASMVRWSKSSEIRLLCTFSRMLPTSVSASASFTRAILLLTKDHIFQSHLLKGIFGSFIHFVCCSVSYLRDFCVCVLASCCLLKFERCHKWKMLITSTFNTGTVSNTYGAYCSFTIFSFIDFGSSFLDAVQI